MGEANKRKPEAGGAPAGRPFKKSKVSTSHAPIPIAYLSWGEGIILEAKPASKKHMSLVSPFPLKQRPSRSNVPY